MPDSKIKVVLIEDSGFMRILISEILRSDPQLDLIATAINGREGVEKANQLQPDVVVTDVMMPEYDGLYVVRNLRETSQIPVILLSSLERTDSQIFEALHIGAFDFVDKPRHQVPEDDYELIPLIKEAAKAKRQGPAIRHAINTNVHSFSDHLLYDVVVIGASTGGPGAVEHIINNLPINFAVPVVIAQHMPERFIETFAQRLDSKGLLKVKIAQKGERLLPAHVYLAPGHSNLRIELSVFDNQPVFGFSKKEFKEFNNPSVDCLFSSAAGVYGSRCIGVLLTGMGRDGTIGMTKIKDAGGYTLAQDESSSVVFGMPKSAADAGALRQMMTLMDIPGFIVSCLSL